ncbi:MAG: sulfotransferase [Rhodanobacter sp.]
MISPCSSPSLTQLRLKATQLVQTEQWDAAQAVLEDLLELAPDDADACIELSDVLYRRGYVRDSTPVLLQAAKHLPRDAPLILKLVRRLVARGEILAARACLDFLALAPQPPAELLVAQAHLRLSLGDIEEARILMARAIDAGVDSPGEWHTYAMLLQFSGDIDKACEVLEQCLRRWPHFGDAAMVLVNLRRQQPASNLLDFVKQQLARLPGDGNEPDARFVRAEFEYAQFKVLDDLGRHDEAWPALARCNAAMHKLNPYNATGEARITEALIGMLDAGLATNASPPADGPTPIFIVGMPRSGTTLLDRMLSAHSDVTSAGEIIDFWRQLHWVADVPPARTEGLLKIIRRSGEIDFAELGSRYLKQTQWRACGRAFYIDKLPTNVQMVAFIRKALPHAPILHMVRDPVDTCFSNFKAMFGNVSPYSYDLQALADYYRHYVRLTAHWRQQLPGAMLDVSYADLVSDPEPVLREVLAHCGLPFEPGCLQPEHNAAPVATPSSAQVRESIHTRGIGQWRNYAQQLEPLRQALSETCA